jgi:AcrR family transcriptional regulator
MTIRPYHHGDLRNALIQAAQALLAERGADDFSLREVARRAGVSPAAPAHHFGDAQGLLTAVATLAFEELAQALRDGRARGGADPRASLREQGVEYVQFALRHPGPFRLMFRDGINKDDEQLAASANEAFMVLADGIRAAFGLAPDAPLDADQWTALVALWSAVHGYAHLAIAGRFDRLGGVGRERFVDATLRASIGKVVQGAVPQAGRAP